MARPVGKWWAPIFPYDIIFSITLPLVTLAFQQFWPKRYTGVAIARENMVNSHSPCSISLYLEEAQGTLQLEA